jgi:hypothetical protein
MSVINEESNLDAVVEQQPIHLEPVAVPTPTIEEPVAVIEEPVAIPTPVIEEPVVVIEEPVAIPTPTIEEPTPSVVEEPVPVVEDPVAVVEDPVAVIEEPVPVIEEPVPVVEDPVPVIEEPAAVPTPTIEEPVAVPTPTIEEPVAVIEDPVAVPAPVIEEPVAVPTPTIEKTDILDPNSNEIIEQTIQHTFHRLFEKTLVDEEFKINPEIKEYLLLLCKENPVFFSDVEESLKKIVVDDKINTKDIPEVILLVGKIYEVINSKNNTSNIDPYEVIKILLQTVFITYFKITNVNNPELEATILHIITVSIQLIKLQAFKPSKKGCLSRLFNF